MDRSRRWSLLHDVERIPHLTDRCRPAILRPPVTPYRKSKPQNMVHLRRLASTLAVATLLTTPLLAQGLGLQLTSGVDGGIDLPSDPLFAPATGITVEAWITYDDATVPSGQYYWPTIARHDIRPQSEVWNFRVDAANTGSRQLSFMVRVAGQLRGATYFFAPGEFSQFTHVAATYDGQLISIYVNGRQMVTTGVVGAPDLVFNGGTTRIGNGDPVSPGLETWNGIIDELRIWPIARTPREINHSMNQALNGISGGALTFSLDGVAIDSSRGIFGTEFGTYSYVPGASGLIPHVPTLTPLGNSSTTCNRDITPILGTLPQVGNQDFAVWCHGGPRPGASPLGFVVAAGLTAPAGQPAFAGVDLAFAAGSVMALTTTPAASALGNTRFHMPIPTQPGLAGTSLIFQFAFLDANCGPQGVSASSGISFQVF